MRTLHEPSCLRRCLSTGTEEALEQEGGAPVTIGRQQLLYCERFVELLTDLLAQLPTRRLMAAVVEDAAVLVKCRLSLLITHPQGTLFVSFLLQLKTRQCFPKGKPPLPLPITIAIASPPPLLCGNAGQ